MQAKLSEPQVAANPDKSGSHSPPRRLAYAALAAVCFFWGTTYLGIRIGLESLPPFYLMGIRYTISGSILLAFAALGRFPLPRGRELLYSAGCGIICIGIGNGCLALAELLIPSGLAALFYTTAPFWMIGVDAFLPGGRSPYLSTLGGLAVGLLGVAFLVWPAAVSEGVQGHTVSGFLLLQLSAFGWVLGALLQKRVRTRTFPFINGAVQQLAAGLAMLVPAAAFEKLPHAVSARSEFAVAYLVVFGSLVGFSSFIYSMTHLPVAVVSIYTFVNPVVAILLGRLFFRESFGRQELVAMVVIFGGIALVRWSEAARRVPLATPAADEPGTAAD